MDFRMRSIRRTFPRAAALPALLVTGALAMGPLAATYAAAPSLGSMVPYAAQRDTEVEILFNGGRLADAQEILIVYPGIEVTHFEVVGDKQVKTRLKIAPDCRLGIHAMRVRSASGISNLRTFMVGALPIIGETEPNNDFAEPQKIDLGVTVHGVVQNEDVDYFLIEAKKGERISVEIEGIRLGNTFFDPYVAIMDMGRFELSNSDDAALVWQDAVASIVAPEDGTYVIQVRESAYGGSGACTYRLHVGRFPRPTGVFPAGGRPGEPITVRWVGDVAGEREEQIQVPTEPTRNFGLFASDEHGIAPSPNAFRVNDLANTLEAEPNPGPDQATAFEAPAALNGIISEPGDVDCYKFAAKKGQVYDVRVYARGIRSPLDSVLAINRIGGAGVAGNDDSGGPDSYVRFTAPEDDEYVLYVKDHLSQGGADYVYRVELTPVQPTLTMGLPERQRYVDVTLSVPRDNRVAILVSGSRANFGGELNVDVQGVPEGVSLETVTMRANRTFVPVLFSAPAEALIAGRLADVTGRHADPNQNIAGHLIQKTSLVRGRNNIRVWDHVTDRMAIAVVEEVPFKIDIVQPKVSLVRNGNMALKVVATRKEGFTAPIAIRMLYNPPGVGSSRSISIPEGQTEAPLPLNANGNAEVRTWKIAVTGQATVGNGPAFISSQLADLDVAEPYFTFAFQAAAVEKGKETDVVIKVENKKPYEGTAKVELLGLPNEVTAEPAELAPDATELVFHVKTTGNSPAGKHKTLLCRAIVTENEEPITHMLGTGVLRIDEPLPPKPDQPAQAAPKPQAAAPQEKRLTRLEQLRLDRQQAKEARRSQPPAEKPAAEEQKAEPKGEN